MPIILTHFLSSTLLNLLVSAAVISLITIITDILYNLINLILICIQINPIIRLRADLPIKLTPMLVLYCYILSTK
jgi:hypothetical protein